MSREEENIWLNVEAYGEERGLVGGWWVGGIARGVKKGKGRWGREEGNREGGREQNAVIQ